MSQRTFLIVDFLDSLLGMAQRTLPRRNSTVTLALHDRTKNEAVLSCHLENGTHSAALSFRAGNSAERGLVLPLLDL